MKLIEIPVNTNQVLQPTAMPLFLRREEIAAQIVALMQAKFTRPGPDEMLQILKCAEQQIIGLLQQ